MRIEKWKLIAPLFLLFLKLNPCQAQTEVSGFGEFTPFEVNLRVCDFDKEAEAVMFFDQAVASYNDDYNLITDRRIRFKILKEKGIDRGNIHIRYYSDEGFESISNIEAVVLNIDGQNKEVWSKLDRKSIYNKRLNKYYSEISFALPNIRVGSIIEYKYSSQMKHYGGLREWVFQSELPILLSSYRLTLVPNSEFAYSVYKSKNLPITVRPFKESGSILFEMNNLPGLREEAYMRASQDYLQRVKFQFSGHRQVEGSGYGLAITSTQRYATTWKELAKELSDESGFGTLANKNLPGIENVQAAWMNETNPFLKMKQIHDYVKSHFVWNHIYSKYAEDGIKESWEKKTGTTAEINFILINLLKSAGFQVDPLLVSDRHYGKVDTTYPYLNQFDKVVVYVTLQDRRYILDGTDHETPSFMIPFDLLNTTGFVVNKRNPALLKITDETRKNTSIVNLTGTVGTSGSMALEAGINNFDYSKIEKKERYDADKSKYQKEFLEPFALTTSDTFNIDGLESDSLPMHHLVKLNYNLNKTGNYFLLNYNLFTGLNKSPFIADQRFTDIDFGCKYLYLLNGTFTLPKNLTPETLPKSITLITPDHSLSIMRQVQQTGGDIQIGIKIDFQQTVFSPENYPEVQSFYKQMLELLNEPIVLKEKS